MEFLEHKEHELFDEDIQIAFEDLKVIDKRTVKNLLKLREKIRTERNMDEEETEEDEEQNEEEELDSDEEEEKEMEKEAVRAAKDELEVRFAQSYFPEIKKYKDTFF